MIAGREQAKAAPPGRSEPAGPPLIAAADGQRVERRLLAATPRLGPIPASRLPRRTQGVPGAGGGHGLKLLLGLADRLGKAHDCRRLRALGLRARRTALQAALRLAHGPGRLA